jgi:heme A synthase
VYVPNQRYARDRFTPLAYITAALALLIIFTGAYVRGSGATLACLTWPDCNGSLFPFDPCSLILRLFYALGSNVEFFILYSLFQI